MEFLVQNGRFWANLKSVNNKKSKWMNQVTEAIIKLSRGYLKTVANASTLQRIQLYFRK